MAIDVGVVGATGAVGRELLLVLEQRGFPVGGLRVFGGERSAGSRVGFCGREVVVERLAEDVSLGGLDVVFFCAGSAVSFAHAERAAGEGALVVDNSSAFRGRADVPLIVPEVNGDGLRAWSAERGLLMRLKKAEVRGVEGAEGAEGMGGGGGGGVVANPNCCAVLLSMVLSPMRRAFGLRGVVVSTYQAVSGAGASAIGELREQCREALDGVLPGDRTRRVFAEPCAFNVFSHDSAVDPATGVNGEERKLIDETRRLLDDQGLAMSATCVRVPVERAHTASVCCELGRDADVREVREVLASAAGVLVVDDRARNAFPTPMKASGGDEVLVGRVRLGGGVLGGPVSFAGGCERGREVQLMLSGDQLRKGAALNAVQIAELVLLDVL